MLKVDWASFGSSIRAQSIVEATSMIAVEKRLGISHARMVAAANGQPVGTEIFLTLCQWLQVDPHFYCTEARHD